MKKQKGFTLVELMIVVVILGILAAIAIPAFIKYIRSSKTSEAKENLAYLYRESSTYYAQERVGRGVDGADIGLQFPASQALTPASIEKGKKTSVTNWDSSATWQALKFAIADPFYYSYQYESTNVASGVGSTFTARACGDLDGDTVPSTFERAGRSNSQREIVGSRGLFETNPLE